MLRSLTLFQLWTYLRAASMRALHVLVILSLVMPNLTGLAEAAAPTVAAASGQYGERRVRQGHDVAAPAVPSLDQPTPTETATATLDATSTEVAVATDTAAPTQTPTEAPTTTPTETASPTSTSLQISTPEPTAASSATLEAGVSALEGGASPQFAGCATSGDLVVASGETCELAAGTYTYNNITVQGGGTIVARGDTVGNTGVVINATSITIETNGLFTADGQGYGSSEGPGQGEDDPSYWAGGGGGAGHAAKGGIGDSGGTGGASYGSFNQPTELGSGGGNNPFVGILGGAGGGAIHLVVSGTITIDGTVSANGNNGAFEINVSGGGGSGGSLLIEAGAFAGSGAVRANGGNGGTGVWKGGGGAGGHVALFYAANTFTGTVEALGGSGYQLGGPGIVYWATDNRLVIDGNGSNAYAAELPAGSYSFASIELKRSGRLDALGTTSTLTLTAASALTGDGTGKLTVFGILNVPPAPDFQNVALDIQGQLAGAMDITIGTNATLTLRARTPIRSGPYSLTSIAVHATGTLILIPDNNGNTNYSDDAPFELSVSAFTVDLGGLVTSDGQGYGSAAGPGAGASSTWTNGGGGAGHGGTGGTGGGGFAGGTPYGSVDQPAALGSGGGASNNYPGGAGGGAINLVVAGTLTLDGAITANGNDGVSASANNSGGGAGGSIWIDANVLAGGASGAIRANGGNGGTSWYGQGGGGAGGRIAIGYDTSTFAGAVQAYGGSLSSVGGAGTIYWAPANRLVIDNNGNNGRSAGLVEGIYSFASIELTRYGHLDVLGTNSSLTLTSSSAFGGDGTGTFSPYGAVNAPATFVIENVSLDVQGQLNGPTDITVGTNGGLVLRARTPLRSGVYAFNSLIVQGTGTLTLVPDNDGDTTYTDDAPLELNVGTLTIETNGILTSDYQGYPSQAGPGKGADWAGDFIQPGGGSHGGWGGIGTFGGATSGAPYGSVYQPITLGSGGGGRPPSQEGGAGGGAIHLVVSGALTINGTLSANGEGTLPASSGGGAGGSIWIQAGTLAGTGKVQTNGGDGATTAFNNAYGIGGGGSGGRIAFEYSGSSFAGTVEAYGGFGGQYGGAGTIYWQSTDRLVINNNNHNGQAASLVSGNYSFDLIELNGYGHLKVQDSASTLTLTAANSFSGDGTAKLAAFGTVTAQSNFVIAGITLDVQGALTGATDVILNTDSGLVLHAVTPLHTGPHTFNSIVVNADGKLTLAPYDNGDTNYANDTYLELIVATMTVAADGAVVSDGLGYKGTTTSGNGPGGGGGDSCYSCGYVRGGGGGYGGAGGNGDPSYAVGGVTYGDESHADALGSAGGAGRVPPDGYANGASGGGAFHLRVSGVLTVNGVISANGADGSGGKTGLTGFGGSGGGSGGSVEIVAGTLAGSGKIQTNGGSSADASFTYGGGGGGGRIIIAFGSFSYSGKFEARGGRGYNNGGDGTISGLILPGSFTWSLTGNDWREGAITACMPCVQQMTVGGPINTLTGAVESSAVDLSFPALGGAMTFQRSYSTQTINVYTTTLGYGWTHNLDTRLIFPGDPGGVAGQVLFKAHSANQYIFYDNGDGTYTAYPGIKATLTRSGSTYTITASDQTTYAFDSQGKLTTWTDAAATRGRTHTTLPTGSSKWSPAHGSFQLGTTPAQAESRPSLITRAVR